MLLSSQMHHSSLRPLYCTEDQSLAIQNSCKHSVVYAKPEQLPLALAWSDSGSVAQGATGEQILKSRKTEVPEAGW